MAQGEIYALWYWIQMYAPTRPRRGTRDQSHDREDKITLPFYYMYVSFLKSTISNRAASQQRCRCGLGRRRIRDCLTGGNIPRSYWDCKTAPWTPRWHPPPRSNSWDCYADSSALRSHRGRETACRDGANIDLQGGHDGSALQAAASFGHNDVVRLLLEKGADISNREKYHGSAL